MRREVEQLVLEAGAMVRGEFHRADGPRGQGDKAAIDDEVEQFLRERLLQLTPGATFQGEESGRVEGSEQLWLVDPHDGTAAFLKGYRGSSVSVALYRDREPLLAVVHSPTYPDDDGDLISWERGGFLERNGEPVEIRVRTRLEETDVVIVSQAADYNPGANLECVSPARFLALPSVAYRMALVACGEAAAGVSLAPTQAHDFAAALPLLQAARLTLVDENERVPDFNSRPQRLFGGSPGVVHQLTGRDWQRVFSRSTPAAMLPGSERLEFPARLRRPLNDPARLKRAQGLWLGQLVGDAFGSLTEFMDPARVAEKFPQPLKMQNGVGAFQLLAGQPTDDSEMALCLARGLLGGVDASAGYQLWMDSHPFDIGMTISGALRGRFNHDSQANGALMRCSPLALAFGGDELRRRGDLDAALTHPNEVCAEANRVYLTAARAFLDGDDLDGAWKAAEAVAGPATSEWLTQARQGPPDTYTRQAGWVKIAFINAFYHLGAGHTFEAAMRQTARAGGDADTNAAILGALMGASVGRAGIPPAWVRDVLTCRPSRSYRATLKARPQFLWPCDALPLAENLAVLGS